MTSSPPTVLTAALSGHCPRCGKGKLFSHFLTIANSCQHCGLSFQMQDSGDGPVFFALIIVGFLSVGMAGYVELRFEPPWWVHVATFVPITSLLILGTMRFFKAWLIALQFRHRPDTFKDL